MPTGYAAYLRVRLQPAKREEFLGLIKQLKVDVERELKGVCYYDVLATADPLEFVLLQGFVDEAAFKVYAEAPFHVAMAPAGWACLDGQPHIEFLTPA